MNKYLSLILISCFYFANVKAQNPVQLPLLYNWDDNNIPNAFYGAYNDCWGYVDAANHEYAILGSTQGTYFFDITNATNPTLISFQKSKDTVTLVTHRDFKTYQHYAYGVSDEGDNSLQIFDLQFLPDSVVKVYDNDLFTKRCHNLFISDDKLFLASNTVGMNYHSMDVLSLADPVNPTFLSTLSSPFFSVVHDVQVRNDTAYCSCGNDGLYIYSYINPLSPVLLGYTNSYPEQGYNHSSWLTSDDQALVFADETHGSGLKIMDITDFTSLGIYSVFRSNLLNIVPPNGPNGSIPHNPFVKGNYAFVSYYHDGVAVFDISDKSNPVHVAYYDTYPANTDYSSYAGCWGVYPFFPSGHIIASDISNGLFIIDASSLLGVNQNLQPVENAANVYYNAHSNSFNLTVTSMVKQNISIELFDIAGRVVYSNDHAFTAGSSSTIINANNFAKGIYTLHLKGEDFNYTKKVCKAD
jgi:choice-of-anchor B domain-containing protein